MSWVAECGRSKPRVDFGRLRCVVEAAEQALATPSAWTRLHGFGDAEEDEALFYSGFLALNTDADGLEWNANDLRFGVLMVQRYAARRRAPGYSAGAPEAQHWADRAQRQALWLTLCHLGCVHSAFISGRRYVSLSERLAQRKRLPQKPIMEMTLAEEDSALAEDPSDRLIRAAEAAEAAQTHTLVREHQEAEESRWVLLCERHSRDSSSSPAALTRALDDLAAMVVHHWLTVTTTDAPADPVQCPELTNTDCDGWWFQGSPSSEFPLLCHAYAHLRLEERLLSRPVLEAPAQPRREAALHALIQEQLRTQIANETLREISRLLCDLALPAGAKTLVRRRARRSMVPTDVMLQLSIGTNATVEILSSLDNEVVVRRAAADPAHPLHDAVAVATLEAMVGDDDERAMFYQEVALLSSDLLDQHPVLWCTESLGKERAPLILRLQGQWYVDHRQTLYTRPGLSFTGAFLCWLDLLFEHHGGVTPGDYSAHLWRQRL